MRYFWGLVACAGTAGTTGWLESESEWYDGEEEDGDGEADESEDGAGERGREGSVGNCVAGAVDLSGSGDFSGSVDFSGSGTVGRGVEAS